MAEDNWRKPLAQVYLLLEEQRKGTPITKEKIEELGRNYPLFEGVPEMFDRLRDHLAEIDDAIDLEFYLLTAGFEIIPAASPIGEEFEAIWGGRLHFEEDGKLAFVRSIVTHEEKMQYILQMAKGMHITTQRHDGSTTL